ncbi:hypothetical protein FOCC_FOCC001573 [Frankliniella occidentalis]|nr:hypothetical protein FOCC_FOCC001573 [Frankliniella occidentalis]
MRQVQPLYTPRPNDEDEQSHREIWRRLTWTRWDTLVRELPCEVPQDSKGLRKNLRGKWKRLVKKKPEDSCSIPPELRDQLKQIYVY